MTKLTEICLHFGIGQTHHINYSLWQQRTQIFTDVLDVIASASLAPHTLHFIPFHSRPEWVAPVGTSIHFILPILVSCEFHTLNLHIPTAHKDIHLARHIKEQPLSTTGLQANATCHSPMRLPPSPANQCIVEAHCYIAILVANCS